MGLFFVVNSPNIIQGIILESKPLVVDLDGTLIKTDLLFETANQFCTRHPWKLFHLLFWLSQGKSSLKANLAQNSKLDPSLLPYNEEVLNWLKEQKNNGRYLILATASHQIPAQIVANYLGIFDEVLATENDINLKAQKKRDRLVLSYGEKGFDYIGNCGDDLPIWQSADTIYVVSSSSRLIKKIESQSNLGRIFKQNKPSFLISFFKALRPHQWLKNILIFVPLVTAFQYTDKNKLLCAITSFLIFSITASSVYILNDLVDVTDDRIHVNKRRRPFAAGDLSLLYGWIIWPVLLTIALVITYITMPLNFLLVLCSYYLLTLSYSLILKQKPILDVVILAALYTLRIIAGAVAVSVPLSFWLLSFSMFLFTSLAFIKRYSELQLMHRTGRDLQLHGRKYRYKDLQAISNMGICAGYLSVLVLALFIQDIHTSEMYGTPKFIWLACPILLYWISRTWLITYRGKMHDDPIIFALKDKVSWIMAGCIIVIFTLARVIG